MSRRELFERLEREELLPLPTQRFVYGEWNRVRVCNYHVNVGGHFYSVPYQLAYEDRSIAAGPSATRRP